MERCEVQVDGCDNVEFDTAKEAEYLEPLRGLCRGSPRRNGAKVPGAFRGEVSDFAEPLSSTHLIGKQPKLSRMTVSPGPLTGSPISWRQKTLDAGNMKILPDSLRER